VSANNLAGQIAEFGNANTWVATIANDGTVNATAFNTTSDRNAKANFAPVNPEAILARVAALPISEWNFKTDPADQKHLGPMAQDFHAAFGLNGADDKHISTVDEGGVALAAIQGLNRKVTEKDAEIQSLKQQNESLEKRLDNLEQMVKSLGDRN
jgi:trimeric autotransporter adhesin